MRVSGYGSKLGRRGRLEFDPRDPALRADPYPLYRLLRSQAPVLEAVPGLWVLTRYRDCLAVLRDHRRFSSDNRHSDLYRTYHSALGRQPTGIGAPAGHTMLFMDPPEHTRLRTVVSKVFTVRMGEALRPAIGALVERLLERSAQRGSMDIVRGLASPLPAMLICHVLGVPQGHWGQLRRWSGQVAPTLDPVMAPTADREASRATEAFRGYFARLIDRRPPSPGPDLITGLIEAEDGEGGRLTEEEIITMCILLVMAGQETTANLISNGMLALLRDPEQLERLRAAQDTAIERAAIEELLRFDPPVQLVGRAAREDVPMGGATIRKGHQVLALLGAGNRDAAQFADPDCLDIGRVDNRHLAFGAGIHHCLGAPLARLEAQIAIGSLIRRFPSIELAGDRIDRRSTLTLRGVRSLPVTIGPELNQVGHHSAGTSRSRRSQRPDASP